MLLREPDGNTVQLHNGNLSLQQQPHEISWIESGVINPNDNIESAQIDSNSVSVGYREGQVRPRLDKVDFASSLANCNEFDSHIDNNINEREQEDRLNLNNLTLNLNSVSPLCANYSSPDEGLFEYEEDQSYSSSNDEEDKIYEHSLSDDSSSNDRIIYRIPRGIHNPNYPGFQHLAYTLQEYPIESPYPCEHSHEDFDDGYVEKLEQLRQYCKKNYSNNEHNNNIKDCAGEINDKQIDDIALENHTNSEQLNEDFIFDSVSLDFTDDLLELRQDIYETIHKPLAETLENIGDVVNNVIKQIVENHDVDCDLWSFSSSDFRLQNLIEMSLKKLQDEDKLNVCDANEPLEIFGDNKENNNAKYDSQFVELLDNENLKSNTLIEKIKTNMDDAYISNVTEEILKNDHYLEKEMSDINKDLAIEREESIKIKKDENVKVDINFNQQEVLNLDGAKCVPTNLENKNEIQSNKNHKNEKKEKKRYNNEKLSSLNSAVKTRKQSNKKKTEGGFDVYNIETAMPNIDLDAIENHLRAAREEERRRRNDREEIRRRLAMGTEHDDFYLSGDRPGRKPSLQSRLQSGMNLQICFMNETASDTESPSDFEVNNGSSPKNTTNSASHKHSSDKLKTDKKSESRKKSMNNSKSGKSLTRPSSLALNDPHCLPQIDFSTKLDFYECQARLQTEARMALAQAKEVAHMQMEAERQRQDKSPITEMLRSSLEKAGVKLMGDRRRVSRQMLTDINVAQLQVIVNELHTQIERLNETLVELLIARDELHMGQDSMLVDIEDLTRHLGAKDTTHKSSDTEKCVSENSFEDIKRSNSQLRVSALASSINK